MDQLHVSMRAAMRPADASRAADVRTRRVEEGARIVAAVPGAVDVVLQMPRGNLETVAPRFLALPAVCAALDGERFAAAAALAADTESTSTSSSITGGRGSSPRRRRS